MDRLTCASCRTLSFLTLQNKWKDFIEKHKILVRGLGIYKARIFCFVNAKGKDRVNFKLVLLSNMQLVMEFGGLKLGFFLLHLCLVKFCEVL